MLYYIIIWKKSIFQLAFKEMNETIIKNIKYWDNIIQIFVSIPFSQLQMKSLCMSPSCLCSHRFSSTKTGLRSGHTWEIYDKEKFLLYGNIIHERY